MLPQALTLNENKLDILAYVESRMSFIAPNMTKVVGSTVAAKLIGSSIFRMLINFLLCIKWSIKPMFGFKGYCIDCCIFCV